MGRAGRDVATTTFDADRLVDAIESIYRDLGREVLHQDHDDGD